MQSAKQKARQSLREIQKDTLYSEYKDKVGEMIIGYYQRERNGNIYVDLGKTEGILPKKYQSPREIYHPNDRIKALIYEVVKTPTGLQIVLSRNHAEFVKKIFELEVPEIYDKTIEIYEDRARARLPHQDRRALHPRGRGPRGRLRRPEGRAHPGGGARAGRREDRHPALLAGLRAASSRTPCSPAEVNQVVILDEAKKLALAIVPDASFSLAIGKQGLNVRLANRLTDWNIDVKTESQFSEMDISAEAKRAVSALFGEPEEEIQKISELPGHHRRGWWRSWTRTSIDGHREPRRPQPRAARRAGRHHRGRHPDPAQDHRRERRDRGGGARHRRRIRRRRALRRQPAAPEAEAAEADAAEAASAARGAAPAPESPLAAILPDAAAQPAEPPAAAAEDAAAETSQKRKRTSVRNAERPSRRTWLLVQTVASV